MCAEKFLTVSTPGVLWLELCSLLPAERMCACPAAWEESPTRAQRMGVVLETLSSLVLCVPRAVACPRKPLTCWVCMALLVTLQNECPHACSHSPLKLCQALDATGTPHKAHKWLPSPPPALTHPVSSVFVHPAVIFPMRIDTE